jgi:hypothetical protein
MFLMVLTIPIAHLPRARLSLENRKQGIYTVSDDWRGAAKGPFTVLRAKDRRHSYMFIYEVLFRGVG